MSDDRELSEHEFGRVQRQRALIENLLGEGPSHPDGDVSAVCTGWVLVTEWMVAGEQGQTGSRRWISVVEREGQSLALDNGLMWTAMHL